MSSLWPSLSQLLDEPRSRHPDKLAVATSDRQLSYAELDDLARRLAASFADAGLAGQRVATLLPNGIELIVCYLACWRAGVTMVPFEYVDAPPEISYGLADSESRWLIVHHEKLADLERVEVAKSAVERVFVACGEPRPGDARFDDLLAATPRELPPVDPATLAFILYTSGSTALPKGVTHSHASAAGIVRSVLAALRRVGEESLIVAHDSVSHMGGWIQAFPLLARGATVVLEKEFDAARFVPNLQRWRPTVLGAHVDHLWQIVRASGAKREDFASLDTVFTGGDELPLALQRAFMDLAGKPIEVGWGMTEAIWLTITRRVELERRGYMGVPVDEVELRVVDVNPNRFGADAATGEAGELWVRGPMVSPGYWRRPQADQEVFVDRWLRTGDMGLRDERGEYWFTGRLKQIIERNSENITPGEIEQALYRHPAVAEAGAFGVPDPDEGQVPIAYVSFKEGASASEDELKSFLATQIAEFKIPVRILPIERIPLTHSGKIDHKALAERYAATVGASAQR
ncbi:MAG TPA: class I adenylate-forming enzyme family protein [Candidatus Binatia bacterium]